MQSLEPTDYEVEALPPQLQDEFLEHLLTLEKRYLRSPLLSEVDVSEIHAQLMDQYAQAFEGLPSEQQRSDKNYSALKQNSNEKIP